MEMTCIDVTLVYGHETVQLLQQETLDFTFHICLPPTVYQGKPLVSHHFRCSYLKPNKISKSEGIRKVEHVHHF